MFHKKDVTCALFLCITIIASVPVAITIDTSSSISGPIFRTQPAPRPAPLPAPWTAPNHSDGHTTVTETDLVSQPALCHTDDQTVETKTAASVAITNLPQQPLQSTQSLDEANLPCKTQPESSNKTAADTGSYAHYCDQDDEYVEDDYFSFFCCIPIILFIMFVLLGHFNLHYFCRSKIKKDCLESFSSQMSNSQCNILHD